MLHIPHKDCLYRSLRVLVLGDKNISVFVWEHHWPSGPMPPKAHWLFRAHSKWDFEHSPLTLSWTVTLKYLLNKEQPCDSSMASQIDCEMHMLNPSTSLTESLNNFHANSSEVMKSFFQTQICIMVVALWIAFWIISVIYLNSLAGFQFISLMKISILCSYMCNINN